MRNTFVAIMICLSITASAQEGRRKSEPAETKDHKHKGTWLGFKAGFNSSNVSGVETDGDKTGYIGGELYGGFFGNSMFNKKWGVGYELLFSWTNDYHFIEIPMHVKYNFNNRLAAFAGPKFDMLVDDQSVGVAAELGLQYNLFKWLFAEGRYASGLTRHVTDPFLDINKGRRNTLRMGLGIRF